MEWAALADAWRAAYRPGLDAAMAGGEGVDEIYRRALKYLRVRPDGLLMIAAHAQELRAVQQLGIRTAPVVRPLEHGPGREVDLAGLTTFDVVAHDLTDLAAQLDT